MAKKPINKPTAWNSSKNLASKGAEKTSDIHRKTQIDCALSSPFRFIQDDDENQRSMLDSALLYQDLHPNTGVEAILASLTVAVSNAAHDCLATASRMPPEQLQHRNINLRLGLKAASTTTQLLDTLERVRGKGTEKVNVGNVNVEAGGQAIVGHVKSASKEDNGGG